MAAVHALVIGINEYAPGSNLPALRGCVPDARAVREALVRRLGIPEENVVLLTDEQATRASILHSWRSHLRDSLGGGDIAYLHFSGHGSMARTSDPAKPSGFDESLVAWDSRLPGVSDLRDTEIAALCAEVKARGVQLILFLDCCHSGGATRAAGDADCGNVVGIRACAPDLRPAPPPLPGAGSEASAGGATPVVLAACLDNEKAAEYSTPDGWHGAATWFFLRALQDARPDSTWAQLYDAVAAGVRSRFANQTPQLSGPGELHLLGAGRAAAETYLLVLEVQGDRILVDGGVALGITTGARLAVLPAGAAESGAPLSYATVEESAAGSAWATLDAETRSSATLTPAARARVVAYGYESPATAVATGDAALRTVLESGRSRLLRWSEAAHAAVAVVDGPAGYAITDAAGTLLARDVARAGDTETVLRALEHVAVARAVRGLRNRSVDPALRGTFSVTPLQALRSSRGSTAMNAQPLERQGGAALARPGQRVGFTLANETDRTLYVAVLAIAPDFSVRRIEPEDGRQVTLGAGRSLPVMTQLPELPPGLAQGSMLIKLCITSTPVSFDSLLLPSLSASVPVVAQAPVRDAGPLSWLLDAMRRTGTRPVRPLEGDSADDQWITHDLEIVMRTA